MDSSRRSYVTEQWHNVPLLRTRGLNPLKLIDWQTYSCNSTVNVLVWQTTRRIGVAIGDQILDLSAVSHLFQNEQLQEAFKEVRLIIIYSRMVILCYTWVAYNFHHSLLTGDTQQFDGTRTSGVAHSSHNSAEFTQCRQHDTAEWFKPQNKVSCVHFKKDK